METQGQVLHSAIMGKVAVSWVTLVVWGLFIENSLGGSLTSDVLISVCTMQIPTAHGTYVVYALTLEFTMLASSSEHSGL